MSDKGMIFSAPMVRALLDGRKTQTRRIIKDRGDLPQFCGGRFDDKNDPEAWGWEDHERGEWITLDQWRRWTFVPWRPGDRLWVRETYRVGAWDWFNAQVAIDYRDGPRKEWLGVADGDMLHRLIDQSRADARRVGRPLRDSYYEYSWPPGEGPCRWRPSIHMPRWASRLTLVVTEVRVQRLQEISHDDAIAEGASIAEKQWSADGTGTACLTDKSWRRVSPTLWFHELWNSLHGPEAWDANPWVAAISFDVHRCNIDAMVTA